jgi:hypothetical protein
VLRERMGILPVREDLVSLFLGEAGLSHDGDG